MFAVIFEVKPKDEGRQEYLNIAALLRDFLEEQKGFISIERFQSLVDEKKVLSLSFWATEPDIANWRNQLDHRKGQQKGKDELFESYRIRVAEVVRDYSDSARIQAPADSVDALR